MRDYNFAQNKPLLEHMQDERNLSISWSDKDSMMFYDPHCTVLINQLCHKTTNNL